MDILLSKIEILQMYVYILNSYFADFGNIIHGLENAF